MPSALLNALQSLRDDLTLDGRPATPQINQTRVV